MISAILVSKDTDFFKGLEPEFNANQINFTAKTSGEAALEKLPVDLLILDENLPDMDGKAFIEAVIAKSPMTNCVIASPRSKKDFHDTYEGYGILMQFPAWPDSEQAKKLISHLNKIRLLQTQAG